VTALHLAVQRGNIDAVRCLLSAGADLDVVDSNYGHTALFYAVERNDSTTSDLLSRSSSIGSHHHRAPPTRVIAPPTRLMMSNYHAASSVVAPPTKCSTDVLQPVAYHRSLPTCCLTGVYNHYSQEHMHTKRLWIETKRDADGLKWCIKMEVEGSQEMET